MSSTRKSVPFLCLWVLLMFVSGNLPAQTEDSVNAAQQHVDDSLHVGQEEFADDFNEVTNALDDAAADSSKVVPRKFSTSDVERLKSDSELQYKQPPTVAESIWDRFLRMLADFFDSLFSNAIATNWGRVLTFIGGLAVLIVLIMIILKIDAFKVFYGTSKSPAMQYDVFDENIHELDFDSEIQRALQEQDYRRGVRLLFLYALKILSDKNYILWEQGKTNHEYVAEVKDESLRKWLDQLSIYFDYVWYGNFLISREVFDKVNGIFVDWKGRVK